MSYRSAVPDVLSEGGGSRSETVREFFPVETPGETLDGSRGVRPVAVEPPRADGLGVQFL